MPASSEPTLQPAVDTLEQWWPLGADDRDAVLALPHRVINLRPQEYIVREGDRPRDCCLILSGFAFRHKIAGTGARQIVSLEMRGDLADLQNSLLGVADHNLQALTRVEAALIPIDCIRTVAFDRPAIGRSMWHETLVETSILREWALNSGRRTAIARTAHILCEFGVRLEDAGLGERCRYELPMTQEQLADAISMTSVHVNRTLMALQREGLISRSQRTVRIEDWQKLVAAGDFDESYLHRSALTGT